MGFTACYCTTICYLQTDPTGADSRTFFDSEPSESKDWTGRGSKTSKFRRSTVYFIQGAESSWAAPRPALPLSQAALPLFRLSHGTIPVVSA